MTLFFWLAKSSIAHKILTEIQLKNHAATHTRTYLSCVMNTVRGHSNHLIFAVI